MVAPRILITGGAGFIGTALAHKLQTLGYNISLIDLEFKFQSIHKDFKQYGLDIRDFKNFKNLKDEKFDFIFHLAAQTSSAISQENPELDVDTNVKGTLNTCNFARICEAKKIIFTSSMATYGNKKGIIKEQDSQTPLSNYGASKLSGERYIEMFKQFGIEHTIFRLFNVYGPGQDMGNLRQGMASIFMAQSLLGDTIQVTGSFERYRDFVYIDDVVNALVIGMQEHSNSQIYNVGSSEATSVKELIELIIALHKGKKFKILNIGGHEGDQFGSVADISKILTLGWKPEVCLKDGLSKMFEYAKEVMCGLK
ncbi:hypothetical protein DMB95_01435 [Campylobacter sp. MIT 12-8780]|uniref:NAD-dependent epimerase/dehydratase family protein n=1 Tax=Campylobacter sp. MIT 12-8780 TaxID=2202200 RepID=UPI00115EA806|nr:NAD-dependent epimerase/dehydratase family protein [Campylobacter sp. MIT 12-8780]TQR43183.1 hypothetical protein DMB95_01435 [Campylobacter sp. MIT 12-8780]